MSLFPQRQVFGMCGRCYTESVELFPAHCAEQPELLLGTPIGQYHCPDCGAMVLAGLPHFRLCQQCLNRKHPGIDKQMQRKEEG